MTDLHDIIRRLERLAPSHRDPFAYHEEKSELVAALRRWAAANDNDVAYTARWRVRG